MTFSKINQEGVDNSAILSVFDEAAGDSVLVTAAGDCVAPDPDIPVTGNSYFTFWSDVSGSMDMPNRLPLLKSAFRLLVNNLRDRDSVSIVAYGGVTGVMLNTTSGGEKEKILKDPKKIIIQT